MSMKRMKGSRKGQRRRKSTFSFPFFPHRPRHEQ
jgi:hypothetical protein